ncbi:hypothetical protein J437_LFUL000313 [Ladona fulva]|uniref:GDNF/GAS1 domain-containing protein n=1 Tax=Ladona fulva TaxID=123851 RepID=A0A8K0K3I5_LADFU|nr:hypothetical protein J437_LFUL000313 [Ladona fulva]
MKTLRLDLLTYSSDACHRWEVYSGVIKLLRECRCSDESCESAKRRASACAPAVAAASRPDAVLPCRVAQWVCAADPVCLNALNYYKDLCRGAFAGRKCTPKCRNSAAILQRQPKAAGLSSCRCDGREDYDCDVVRRNTERLCFRRNRPPNTPPMSGEIPLIPEEEGKRPGAAIGDTDTNEIMRISGALAGGRSGTPKTADAMQLVLIAAVLCIRGYVWSTDLLLGLNS